MSGGQLFTYDLVAEVEVLSPSIGPVMEAITLTVYGRNFVGVRNLTCAFGDQVRVNAIWRNSRMLEVPSPTGLTPGEYPVYVTMNGIDLTSSYAKYLSRTVPRVFSVVPSRSDVAGGGVGDGDGRRSLTKHGGTLLVWECVSESISD